MAERLFLLAPSVVMAARVNEPSTVTYPTDGFDYDGVSSGSYSDITAGMTLLLGSSAGADDYGRQRIRGKDATTLYVSRTSQGTHDGELDVVDNAYITVLDDYRVWAKIPYIDSAGDVFKDGDLAAAGNASTPPPIANAGRGFCGTIDPDTSVVTVQFDASDSVQFDAAISSALSVPTDFLWDVGDGTITVGTSTDDEITVTFPAGFRWVKLTVTADNAQAQTRYVPVYARDPDNDTSIANFQVVSQRITPQGQELAIRVLEDIERDTYPDGTLVMLWDDALEVSTTERRHVLFVGWHQRDDNATVSLRTGITRDTVLHCVDVAGRLKTLPGFPQELSAAVSVSKWTQTRYPNVFYYLWYLLHWHSTALDVADILLGTQILNNFDFKIMGSDAGSLYDQTNDMANRVTPDHHLTCNRGGQLMLVVDPLIQNFADRSSDTHDTITDNEWTETRYSGQRPPRVYKILTYAVDSDSAALTPMAAMAPGVAEGQGLTYIETSERVATSQSALNICEGNRYARLNAPYGPYTIVLPYEELSTTHDPAYMGWVRLSINSLQRPWRGDALSSERGVVREMTIQREYTRTGVVRTATLLWERETYGKAAETVVLDTYYE